MQIKNKNIMVAGLGKSGVAAMKVLDKLGAKVAVYDAQPKEKLDIKLYDFLACKKIECYLGVEPSDEVLKAQATLVLSPGISLETELVVRAKNFGVVIIGELELAYQIAKGKFIAITGTNGKTTTTTLVGKMFKNAGYDTRIVGNIGNPVVTEALESSDDTWLITEASSFQLETIKDFKPVGATILNLTEDHLNRHKTMENYGIIKANIFKNQDENNFYAANVDDETSYNLTKLVDKVRIVPFTTKKELDFGVCVVNDIITVKDKDEIVSLCNKSELKIPGQHNLENALAAVTLAYFAGIPEADITKTLLEFEGVEHRIEYVDTINGVRFINDSKGTNPDSSIKAVYAMQKNIILIAGGSSKNSDYTSFVDAFEERVKALVLQGETANAIAESADKAGFTNIYFTDGMRKSVEKAYELASEGDVVLLSPACASFDFYSNFEERGRDFKEKVRILKENVLNF